MRFDAAYSEEITLRDGTQVLLRPVRPDDAPMLLRAFERLSPHSRYLRFLGPKAGLSASELSYLTHVDGVRHFALAAIRLEVARETDGLGIARFVTTAPGIAEPAVAVIDEMQGKGLGRALLERLHEAALERGIVRFSAEVLETNTPVISILEHLGPTAVASEGEGVLRVDISLAGAGSEGAPAPAHGTLYRFLSLAARGAVVLRGVLKDSVVGQGR